MEKRDTFNNFSEPVFACMWSEYEEDNVSLIYPGIEQADLRGEKRALLENIVIFVNIFMYST